MRSSTRLAAAAVIGVLAAGGVLYLTQPRQPTAVAPDLSPALSASSTQPARPSAVPSSSLVAPRAASWSATRSMITARRGFSVTLLRDGRVLVAGGMELVEGIDTALAELYDPGPAPGRPPAA